MSDLPQRLYLAGPMSGRPQSNFPLFNRVAGLLRARGHEVFNPAENKDGGVRRTRAYYMRLDIPALLDSQAVVLLPGWRESRGASLEVWIALDLDMPVYECSLNDGEVTVTGNQYGNTGTAEVPFGVCLLGDVNNDTVVNAADRSIVNAFWMTGAAGSFTLNDCDVNGDGVVNAADRSIVHAVWRGTLGQNSVGTKCPNR